MQVRGYIRKEVELSPEEVKDVKRLPTSIEVLDKAIEGGIPYGSWVVITGEPGTGKTVLTHHLVSSAIKNGFAAVIVSTELKKWEWEQQAKRLSLTFPKIKKLEELVSYNYKEDILSLDTDGVTDVTFADIYTLSRFARILASERKKAGRSGWVTYLDPSVLIKTVDVAYRLYAKDPSANRISLRKNVLLVVDSISMFYLHAPNMAGKVALDLALRFKYANTVGALVTQYAWTTGTTYGARVEHIADGIFHLWMENVEKAKEVKRYLIIKKMRMTNHSLRAFKVMIEPGKGMVLEPL